MEKLNEFLMKNKEKIEVILLIVILMLICIGVEKEFL